LSRHVIVSDQDVKASRPEPR